MPTPLPADDALIIEALVTYYDVFRDRNPKKARRAWVLARDRADEYGLTIDDVVSDPF